MSKKFRLTITFVLLCIILSSCTGITKNNSKATTEEENSSIYKFQDPLIVSMTSDMVWFGQKFEFPLNIKKLPANIFVIKNAKADKNLPKDKFIGYKDSSNQIKACAYVVLSPNNDSIAISISPLTSDFSMSGIKIGSTVDELIKTFPNYGRSDKPDKLDPNNRVYPYATQGSKRIEETIIFRVKEGKVTEILFENRKPTNKLFKN